MSENRAADYIAFGMNRGVDRFLGGMERRREEEKKQREEEKQRAREFKGIVEFLDASGMMSKDKAITYDLDSVRGIARGMMYHEEQQRLNNHAALQEFAAAQKMNSQVQTQGWIGEYNNSLARSPGLSDFYEFPEKYANGAPPPVDAHTAFANATQAYPGADPQDIASFGGAMDRLAPAPKEFAPTEDFRTIQEIAKLKSTGKPEDAAMAAQMEEWRQARMHPSGQERFDLPYSQQKLMENELGGLHATYTNPDLRPGFIKEAEKAKMTPDQLYLKKLNAIEEKYRSKLRKGHQADTPKVPVSATEPKKISTQADFDALPVGALFINPADGATYKKK